MKRSRTIAALALFLAFPLVACSKEEAQAAGDAGSKALDSAKEMGSKAADAIQKQFGELKSMAESKTAGVDDAIAELKKKAEAKGAEAKPAIDELISDLGKKKDEVVQMIKDVDWKAVDSQKIEEWKKKLEPAMAELQKLIDKAKSM